MKIKPETDTTSVYVELSGPFTLDEEKCEDDPSPSSARHNMHSVANRRHKEVLPLSLKGGFDSTGTQAAAGVFPAAAAGDLPNSFHTPLSNETPQLETDPPSRSEPPVLLLRPSAWGRHVASIIPVEENHP